MFPFSIQTLTHNPAHAEIRLVYAGLESFDSSVWKCTVVGPYCHERQTIAVAYAASSPTEQGWIVHIPEPCLWSAATPFLYEVKVQKRGEQYHHRWGIRALTVQRKRFLENQEPMAIRAVRVLKGFDETLAGQLRRAGVNSLMMPLSELLGENAQLADRYGFHVLYEINPEEDELLWKAESTLPLHISTMGYLLPQATMQQPQLWHNAMLHLHRQRRDIFIGIPVDTLPLSVVQGHVEFLVAPSSQMEELAVVKMPVIASVRRFDVLAEELPTNWAGRVSRVLPGE
ncbi:MAG TPA: hypothetical protein PKD72_06730 [Gemmatales bacterium]|nr:hypothetical protein [Gemmatales bacterium]